MCGCVCSQWSQLIYHLKNTHLPVFYIFRFLVLSHLRITEIDLSRITNPFRSELIGTVLQQQERLVKLIWLSKNLPRAPRPKSEDHHFSFPFLFQFEAGMKQVPVQTQILIKNLEGRIACVEDPALLTKINKGHKASKSQLPLTKFNGTKNYQSHQLLCPINTRQLEHESSTTSFKPAYTSSVKEERQYVERVHLRASQGFGFQSVRERIKQIPSFSKSLLERIDILVSGFNCKDSSQLPTLTRLEIRQSMSLGLQLELWSIYSPYLIGPSI